MIENLAITVLVNDKSSYPQLAVEHGLSIWIEADDHRIIFDTGKSSLLIKNAGLLGIDLSVAEFMILSHGHYDHTGGVDKVLELNPEIKVFCHPALFIPRYSRQPDGRMKPIGINSSASVSLDRVYDKISWVNEPLQIIDGIYVTGPIPRKNDFEDTGGHFFFDKDGICTDPVMDDLSIWFETSKGLVMVTGCCHSGLVNTIQYVTSIAQMSITTLIGGFHLLNASGERIEKTIKYLKKQSIKSIMPLHCTGENSVAMLRRAIGDIVKEGSTGTQMKLTN